MKTFKQLMEAIAAIRQKATDEKRTLSVDEGKEIEGLLAEARTAQASEKMLADVDALDADIRKIVTQVLTSEPDNLDGNKGAGGDGGGDNKDQGFRHFGEFLQAVATASRSQGNRVDERLIETRATGMSEGVPAEGGYRLQNDFATELFRRIHAASILAARTMRIPIGPGANGWEYNALDESSRVAGTRNGGVRVFRLNEGGTLTGSKAKFRRGELKLEKQIGLYYATDEQLKDDTALATVMSDLFTSEFSFEFDDEVYRGDGAGEPLGILNADALVTVAKEGGQAATTIVSENIFAMHTRLWTGSLPNAAWYINQDCWPQIFQLSVAVGTGGSLMFIEPGRIPAAPNGSLLGLPIQPIEQASTLGTVGDIVLADMSQYMTIEKGGLEMTESIHVQFLTDETAFRFIVRNNGAPRPEWNTALTPKNGSKTVSPFIALASRS